MLQMKQSPSASLVTTDRLSFVISALRLTRQFLPIVWPTVGIVLSPSEEPARSSPGCYTPRSLGGSLRRIEYQSRSSRVSNGGSSQWPWLLGSPRGSSRSLKMVNISLAATPFHPLPPLAIFSPFFFGNPRLELLLSFLRSETRKEASCHSLLRLDRCCWILE